ncbi:MAG: B12-binding domain-containing protein [Candidatus Thiodiazotropha sp.]
MSINKELTNLILDADREGAMELINEWCEENSINDVVEKVLVPALATLSTIWDKLLEPPLAPTYVTSRLIHDVMRQVAGSLPTHDKEKLGSIVICNIEDDFHSLGREVVTSFLEANGWKVYDLGNDVPASELIDKAVEVDAKVVGVSAMMLTTALNIKKVREEINRRGLNKHIQLAVGGAIFTLRETLVDEVGGDGTCKTALGAHELFKSLWAKAEEANSENEQ